MPRKLILSAVCLGLVGLSAPVFERSLAVADEKETAQDAPGGADDPLRAYLEASQPGPEHAKLRMLVGNWKVAGTFYMAPGAPPMESEATANIRPMMGGRYFREKYTGEFMGQKFSGVGTFGYDKGIKKYVSVWIDSMSTALVRSEGTADDSGDVISYVGEYFDPVRQQVVTTKYVVTLTSRQTHTVVMYELSSSGDQKIMELVYTRVKRDNKDRKKQKDKKAKDA